MSMEETEVATDVTPSIEPEVEIPADFLDPIDYMIMTDPVKVPTKTGIYNICDRATMERAFREQEENRKRTNSPFDRTPLTRDQLESDISLKEKIDAFLKEHPNVELPDRTIPAEAPSVGPNYTYSSDDEYDYSAFPRHFPDPTRIAVTPVFRLQEINGRFEFGSFSSLIGSIVGGCGGVLSGAAVGYYFSPPAINHSNILLANVLEAAAIGYAIPTLLTFTFSGMTRVAGFCQRGDMREGLYAISAFGEILGGAIGAFVPPMMVGSLFGGDVGTPDAAGIMLGTGIGGVVGPWLGRGAAYGAHRLSQASLGGFFGGSDSTQNEVSPINPDDSQVTQYGRNFHS